LPIVYGRDVGVLGGGLGGQPAEAVLIWTGNRSPRVGEEFSLRLEAPSDFP
jgi:hypothetical protein